MDRGVVTIFCFFIISGNFLSSTNAYYEEDNENETLEKGKSGKENDDDTPCLCHFSIHPVCGVNGVTYPNRCFSMCKKVKVKHGGLCDRKRSLSPLELFQRWDGKVKYGGHTDVVYVDRYGGGRRGDLPKEDNFEQIRNTIKIPSRSKRWTVSQGGHSKVNHVDRFGDVKRGYTLNDFHQKRNAMEIPPQSRRWTVKQGGHSKAYQVDRYGDVKRVYSSKDTALRELRNSIEALLVQDDKRWNVKLGGQSKVSHIDRHGNRKREDLLPKEGPFSSLLRSLRWNLKNGGHSEAKHMNQYGREYPLEEGGSLGRSLRNAAACNCKFDWDPVCTEIGVTYYNSCWAKCRGFKYTKGECP